MGKIRVGLIYILILLLSSSFFIPAARADYQLPYIESLHANVEVKNNGLTKITQTITFKQSTALQWPIYLSGAKVIEVESDGKNIMPRFIHIKSENKRRLVMIDKKIRGIVWRIKFQSNNSIGIRGNQELLEWQVVRETNSYINEVYITLNSPWSLNRDDTTYKTYAFHGVASNNTQLLSERTVVFSGSGVGPEGGFTITVGWPKSTFQFGMIRQFVINLSLEEISFWIIFGIVLPILSIITLLIIYVRRKRAIKYEMPNGFIEKPPNNLPPVLVGILYDKKITANVMLAAIIDLCQRGYVVIVKEKNKYIFGKRKAIDNNLRDWEKQILKELFANATVWIRSEEIETQSKQVLFSPKIKHVYEAAYTSATSLGYFRENPHLARVKFKLVGILFYLTSIVGLGWIIFSYQPSFLLIPMSGVLLSSFVILKMAPLMPQYSLNGLKAKGEWLRFRNFLKKKEPLPADYSVGGFFYEYLPYALAMTIEKRWMRRFRTYRLVMPEWYITNDNLQAEQAIQEILVLIRHLSGMISKLKGPAVT